MSAVIDLPRAKKALAALDKIAAEHPEICQGLGQWDEKAVAGIVNGKPGSERQAEYRRKLAARGIKREIFFATPEAQTALAELRALHPDKTRDNILCDAVINLLAAQRTPDRPAPATLPLFDSDTTPDERQATLMLAVDGLVNVGKTWRDIATALNEAGWHDKAGKPLVYSRLNEQWRAWKRAKGES